VKPDNYNMLTTEGTPHFQYNGTNDDLFPGRL
jgi:hypothetical protein